MNNYRIWIGLGLLTGGIINRAPFLGKTQALYSKYKEHKNKGLEVTKEMRAAFLDVYISNMAMLFGLILLALGIFFNY